MDFLIRTCVLAIIMAGICGIHSFPNVPTPVTHIAEGPNYYVDAGSTINLTCFAGSHFAGAQLWLHDEKAIDLSSRESIRIVVESGPNPKSLLQVMNARPADAGKYTCQPREGDSTHIVVYVLDALFHGALLNGEENNALVDSLLTTDDNNNLATVSVQLETLNVTRETFCTYKGVSYSLGSHIQPDASNPCFMCECNSDVLNDTDRGHCFQKECPTDDEKHSDAKCAPVYQEGECCPVEYHCPQASVEESPLGIISELKDNTSINGSQCVFAGKTYSVGSEIKVDNPCIKCICSVPPYVRCIRQTCPPNSRNCPSTISNQECCPVYQCPPQDETVDNATANPYENCPTPLCADKSCVIGVPPGYQCPTCICKDPEKENIFEDFHEKNDLEPFLNEIDNGTAALDNEIQPLRLPKNFTEREYLLPKFEENIPHHEHFEKEETTSLKLPPKILLLDKELTTSNETDAANTLAEHVGNSTHTVGEIRRKRSGHYETAGIQPQQQWNVFQQDQFIDGSEDSGENSERELEGNEENFSEVKILSTKTSKNGQKSFDDLVELDDNELENVIWTTEVSGCPAPMCADSSCRIGIPPGHTCPTCVCKKRRRQP